MQQKVIIELYNEVGHPDNAKSKESILCAFSEELPELLSRIKYPSAAFNWSIDSIIVEK